MTERLDINDLLQFSLDLYRRRQYGTSLLVVHGISLGVKIGKQLPLKWSDFITNTHKVKKEIIVDGKKIKLNETCKEITLLIYNKRKNKINLNDYIYTTKNGSHITTSNLSKNLKRYALKFYDKRYDKLKSSSLERAWALSVVEANNYSKESFNLITDIAGKRTITETYSWLGCEPIKPNLEVRHDYIDNLTLSLNC
jgi:hypothetical protein